MGFTPKNSAPKCATLCGGEELPDGQVCAGSQICASGQVVVGGGKNPFSCASLCGAVILPAGQVCAGSQICAVGEIVKHHLKGAPTCEDGTCRSIDDRNSDDWCEENCHHDPPHCPEEHCSDACR